MLNKSSKIRILENFYAVDYVLFGKPLKKMKFENNELVEEYVAIKSALLSTLIEMFSVVGHTPKPINEKLNTLAIKKMAIGSAKIARENCEKLVTTDKARENIKRKLRESVEKENDVTISEFVQNKIRQEAYSLAIDNLLVARTISESENYKNLNEWEGKIIEDAYKVLRRSLIETATKLIYG